MAGAIDPTKLPPKQLVELLKKAGSKTATEALIKAHVAAGAPHNADGSIHLLHYTAWLARQAK